jgi:hypothetical protein
MLIGYFQKVDARLDCEDLPAVRALKAVHELCVNVFSVST